MSLLCDSTDCDSSYQRPACCHCHPSLIVLIVLIRLAYPETLA